MRSMQSELTILKAELSKERQARTQEVSELQREVRTLRGQLEQALRDLSAANDRVSCALTSETALRGRSMEMLRKEVADAIQLSAEVHHLKTIQATHFGKLATELKTERSERQAAQQSFDAMLGAEVQTRVEESTSLAQCLAQQQKLAEDNLKVDREAFNSLLKDVRTAGELLNLIQEGGSPAEALTATPASPLNETDLMSLSTQDKTSRPQTTN